jgi:hypothetical protein
MAEEKVGIKIEVDGSQVTKSVGNVRKELKEANAELVRAQQEFGDYSQQAVAAAKKVAQLRDQISAAAETAKLFDPGAKFAAFSGAINAVAGGFAAVQGALGLVGVESEDLQKQLLKVQSALALSEGLSKVTDAAKDFKGLNATIRDSTIFQKGLAAANLATAATQKALGIATVTTSTGFKVLRGAIVATGIGALAIGLIALVQNFDKVKKAVLDFIPGLSSAADAIGRVYNRITDFIGITSEAQRQTERVLKANAAAIRATERELDVNGDKYDEYTKRKIEANLRYRKSFEELTKDESLSVADRDKFIKDARERANRDIAAADKDRQAAADKVAEDAAKKEADRQKAASERAKAAADQRLQIEQQGEAELAKLRQDNRLAAIKDEDQRRIKEIELDLKATEDRVNATKLSEDLKTQIIVEARKKADTEIQAINQKFFDDEAARIAANAAAEQELRDQLAQEATEKEIERKLLSLEALQEVGLDPQTDLDARAAALKQADDLNTQYLEKGLIDYEEYVRRKKIIAAAEVQIEVDKREAQLATLQAVAQGLNNLASLVGQNTAAGKALAIAAATIDTYASTASLFRAASNNPISIANPAYPYIIAASSIAAGLARVRQIVSVKVPNSSGGGGAAPSIGGAGFSAPAVSSAAPLQPFRPPAQVFELGQQSLRGINTASTRAYVVESDITSSQERVTRLNRAARLA